MRRQASTPVLAAQSWSNLALGCALLLALPVSSLASERYPLVFDPSLTGLMGARDLATGLRLADRGLDAVLENIPQDRDALVVAGRVGRALLADLPLVLAAITVQHEVFGHGYRAREFGLAPTYHLVLPPPYGWNLTGNYVLWNTSAYFVLPAADKALALVEGQHSEELLVHELEREALLSGRWGRLAGALAVARAVGDLERLVRGEWLYEGDWASYKYELSDVPNAWRHTEAWKSCAQWVLDPVVWWSAYDYFVRHLLRGEKAGPLPTLRVGSARVLARSAFRMAPWGEELGLLGYAAWPDAVAEAQLLVGASDGALPAHLSVGGTLRELFPRVDLGGRADVWTEPRYGPLRFPAAPTRATGGLLELELSVRVFDWGRPLALVGTKSQGFVTGRPWLQAAYAQGGIQLDF